MTEDEIVSEAMRILNSRKRATMRVCEGPACPLPGKRFKGQGRALYCGDKCRGDAFRERNRQARKALQSVNDSEVRSQ